MKTEIKIGDLLRRYKISYEVDKIIGRTITLQPIKGEIKTIIGKDQLEHFYLEKPVLIWKRIVGLVTL